jgi:DNA-binding transcriptional ArsR family regulator
LTDQNDVLRGLTLKVYRFILRNGDPSGIREIQRALKLSSPTLALYHVNKLEEAGLVRKHETGYVADRIVLENYVRLKRTLIPRFFFYTVFFAISLVILTTLLRPAALTREYVFSVVAISIGIAASAFETARAFSSKSL